MTDLEIMQHAKEYLDKLAANKVERASGSGAIAKLQGEGGEYANLKIGGDADAAQHEEYGRRCEHAPCERGGDACHPAETGFALATGVDVDFLVDGQACETAAYTQRQQADFPEADGQDAGRHSAGCKWEQGEPDGIKGASVNDGEEEEQEECRYDGYVPDVSADDSLVVQIVEQGGG